MGAEAGVAPRACANQRCLRLQSTTGSLLDRRHLLPGVHACDAALHSNPRRMTSAPSAHHRQRGARNSSARVLAHPPKGSRILVGPNDRGPVEPALANGLPSPKGRSCPQAEAS